VSIASRCVVIDHLLKVLITVSKLGTTSPCNTCNTIKAKKSFHISVVARLEFSHSVADKRPVITGKV